MLKKLFGMSGALALAQLINFVAISYGSKIFGAEDFGKYSYVNSLSLAMSVVFYLRSDNLILLEQEGAISEIVNAINKFSKILILTLFLSTSVFLFNFNNVEMLHLTILGFVLAYFNSKFIVYGAILIRDDKILEYGITGVVKPIIMIIGQYFINVFPKLLYPMVIVRVLSELITSIFRRLNVNITKTEKINLKRFIVDRKDYLLYGTAASLLNSVSQQLPMLILPFKYGYSSLAYFSLAFSLTIAPITLIFSPLRNLLLKKISNISNREEFIIKNTAVLVVPTLLLILSFYSFSGYLIDFVWGHEWHETGKYMQWIIFWVASGLLSSPAYCYIIFSAKQKCLIHIENLFLILKCVFMFFVLNFNIRLDDAIIFFIVLGVLYNLVVVLYSFNLIRIIIKKFKIDGEKSS
ncbi:hypothetical protein DDN99_17540 [Vibrio cholerae]|nr:hypothetical protein [Vibrio cholerae]